MSIEIKIYGEDAGHALRELRDFAVGLQGRPASIGIAEAQNFAAERASNELISSAETVNTPEALDAALAADKPTRVPGQPSPGKARRTKAEVAEDEAAAKANHDRVAAIKEDVLAGAAEQQAAYDSPEVAAQDAADEAAESAANKTGLTLDDLRHAAARYQKKFGMAAAVAGIPALLGCAMVDVPESELAAAIAKIDEAVKGDASGAIEEKVAEVKAATKEDLVAAMKRYALKFDGQDTDMNAMPHTMTDCPAIFKLLFGEGVEKLSQVPAEGYARTIAAIDEAIEKDPFKRGAK
ncbi:MAG: hypothetical protein EOQ31_31455 [Mesorhizobium sp.]|uniref:hypothetical protein n=1 Tax=Mesorhizobium sp. TaxID=1871066 RepID=UPI000FE48DF0|nr:hypothetical protein [Mesorhizobium sp.]RWA81465.1 MAG: hypothetical protein EOQ31_31455 [Mesorhizobium sp.]